MKNNPVFDALRSRYPDEIAYPDEDLFVLAERAQYLRDTAVEVTEAFARNREAAFDELIPDGQAAKELLPGVMTMLGSAPEEGMQVCEDAARSCLAEWIAQTEEDGDPRELFSDEVLTQGVAHYADAVDNQAHPGDMYGQFDSAVLLGMLRGLRSCANICFFVALPCAAVLLLSALLRSGEEYAQEKLAQDSLKTLRPEDIESAGVLHGQLAQACEAASPQAAVPAQAATVRAQNAARENPAQAFAPLRICE